MQPLLSAIRSPCVQNEATVSQNRCTITRAYSEPRQSNTLKSRTGTATYMLQLHALFLFTERALDKNAATFKSSHIHVCASILLCQARIIHHKMQTHAHTYRGTLMSSLTRTHTHTHARTHAHARTNTRDFRCIHSVSKRLARTSTSKAQ